MSVLMNSTNIINALIPKYSALMKPLVVLLNNDLEIRLRQTNQPTHNGGGVNKANEDFFEMHEISPINESWYFC